MKKLALAVSLFAASAVSASAADLAARPYTKAPPPVIAAAYDWSGFYIGANGGYGSSRKCWEVTSIFFLGPIVPAAPEGCHDATGGVAGGQIGYRWQASSWVFGVEAQGDWADLRGSNQSISLFPIFGVVNRSRIDAFGLFTGQIGYAFNNVLLYVKGGGAVTRDKYNGLINATGITFDEARETRWGGAVGVGVEYGFTPNWSAAIEYDHLFMGTRGISMIGIVPPIGVIARTENIRQDVDLLTVRVNYRFGGPVVARY
jgi:outer membrane immunogenic protein